MRAILLAPFTKKLVGSVLLVVALALLLGGVLVANQVGTWRAMQRDYATWHSDQGTRCLVLYEQAYAKVTADSACGPIDHRSPTYAECTREDTANKERVIAEWNAADCPTVREGSFENFGLRILIKPDEPGSLLQFTAQMHSLEVDVTVISFVTATLALLLLLDLGKHHILELHLGWRRLNIILPLVGGLLGGAIYVAVERNAFPTALGVAALTLTGTLVLLIYDRLTVRWVGEGFAARPQAIAPAPAATTATPIQTASSAIQPAVYGEAPAVTAPLVVPAPKATLPLASAAYWPRFWARCVDLPVTWILGSVLAAFIPTARDAMPGATGIVADTLLGMIAICIVIFWYEALCVARWGATPGKMLFGLTVRDVDGGLPSMAASRKRAWGYLQTGLFYTLFLPTIQIIGAVLAYRRRHELQPWDVAARTVVRQRSIFGARYFAAAVLAFVMISSAVGVHMALKKVTKEEIRRSVLSKNGFPR